MQGVEYCQRRQTPGRMRRYCLQTLREWRPTPRAGPELDPDRGSGAPGVHRGPAAQEVASAPITPTDEDTVASLLLRTAYYSAAASGGGAFPHTNWLPPSALGMFPG
jgi:hypothetical protein